ncbi:trypsin-like peptidase domain-containing protein [Actinoplanes sp. Pm04-4]|uniref:Trypsin-like peptidase domain-containing protein n=1 Tax=Paractinoplanes pyxinae TaxID=2997416 RepID=A0ABT4B3V5_9ACTN|nr:trypsin-like peptidase domain-containing protein [Actinoplanes pyxinae]MCY1141183.1 trypsin-like peptidase domain-containing protein [Actinoplanes pyxinae]
MNEPRWQARIDIPDSHVRGSGFLVDDRHVLTCAHVVRGQATAQVTLGEGDESRKATVLRDGPWWSPGAEAADVAVLELSVPVDVEPAPLAPHAGLEVYGLGTLDAYGFPLSYAETGVYSEFRAGAQQFIGADVQVRAEDDLGVWLQEGFSGAAARHQGTEQVLGMVRKAGRGRERIGVIVPVARLAEVCPALDELIPLGSLSPTAYRELRGVLAATVYSRGQVRQLLAKLRSKVPSMPGHLTSLAGVVEALVVDAATVDDDEMRFYLAGLLVKIGTDEARRWAGVHLYAGPLPSSPVEAAHEGAIVVKLEPVAGQGAETYDLTVWTVTDPDGELGEPVAQATGLLPGSWQGSVERALAEAVTRMPLRVFTVEFVLPRDLLAEPVERWRDHTDDTTRLGVSSPLVVRDLDWFDHDNPARLGHRAELLRENGADLGRELRWRDHSEPPTTPDEFRGWLRRRRDDPLAIGLTCEWTTPEQVGLAVAAGPPVLIWRRAPCLHDEHEDDCDGRRFARELTARLGGVTFDQVAHAVRDLRAEAAYARQPTHCGSDLVLLRDDARRRTVPLGFA